jgi:hypothetical protein
MLNTMGRPPVKRLSWSTFVAQVNPEAETEATVCLVLAANPAGV